jgi:hypothetical protein
MSCLYESTDQCDLEYEGACHILSETEIVPVVEIIVLAINIEYTRLMLHGE